MPLFSTELEEYCISQLARSQQPIATVLEIAKGEAATPEATQAAGQPADEHAGGGPSRHHRLHY